MMNPRPILAVFATLDPRGNKIGGIETHIRHILRNHPAECDLVLVGIDEFGDLACGMPHQIELSGRRITFLPVVHVAAEEARASASRLSRSTTLRFVLGGLRHLGALRKAFSERAVSADLPRVEFAILPILLGIPYVLTIHSDLETSAKTDSLLKHYRRIKAWSEGFAFHGAKHVFAVSAAIRQSLIERYPPLASHCDVLPVPVDTELFLPSAFPSTDLFHIVYAGRLDEVKDPALMFLTIALISEQLRAKIRFHMIGPGNAERFPEFAPIRALTEQHGAQNAERVAKIIRNAHAAIMTSHSEGLPCFLLEALASGRAFGAMRLPTFESFIINGKTGRLVDRQATITQSAQALADAFVEIWHAIQNEGMDPNNISHSVSSLSVKTVFARLFEIHKGLRPNPANEVLSSTPLGRHA